jgi:hypothetical protein
MVKVARPKGAEDMPVRKRRRPRTRQLHRHTVREDHYALLLSADY